MFVLNRPAITTFSVIVLIGVNALIPFFCFPLLAAHYSDDVFSKLVDWLVLGQIFYALLLSPVFHSLLKVGDTPKLVYVVNICSILGFFLGCLGWFSEPFFGIIGGLLFVSFLQSSYFVFDPIRHNFYLFIRSIVFYVVALAVPGQTLGLAMFISAIFLFLPFQLSPTREPISLNYFGHLYARGLVKIIEVLVMCFSSFGSIWILTFILDFDAEVISLAGMISIPVMNLYNKLLSALFKRRILELGTVWDIFGFRIVSILAALFSGMFCMFYLKFFMDISENLSIIFLVSALIGFLSSNSHLGLISSTRNISGLISLGRVVILGVIFGSGLLELDIFNKLWFTIFSILSIFLVLDVIVIKRFEMRRKN